MNQVTKLAIIVGSSIAATISAQANLYTIGDTVSVQETGVSPNKIVSIHSSTLGDVTVYAGVTQLKVNGVVTNSFCIDPYQWSSGSAQSYTVANLASTPSPVMGATAAWTVNNLWANYYSQALVDASVAAGLQIAIWETVAGSNFSVIGPSDFGAAGMITFANAHAADAGLVALSSRTFQDYVVQNVPDAGTTLVLLGLGLVAMAVMGRRVRSVSTITS